MMRALLILIALTLAIPAGRFAATVHAKAESDAACSMNLEGM